MMPPTHDSGPSHAARGPSRVLLIFLVFPLLGLAAALVMIISSQAPPTPAAVALPTPPPVTLAPVPTAVTIANAPIIDFELTSLDGETVRLSDYNGRIVFLNFWASWCEPCTRELPAMQEFVRAQPEDGAVVLAVNVEESAETVTAFLAEQGIRDLEILLDRASSAAASYGVFNIPVTFIIDEAGIVRYPKYGEITQAEMNGYVQSLRETR